jgi:hypothetical protein
MGASFSPKAMLLTVEAAASLRSTFFVFRTGDSCSQLERGRGVSGKGSLFGCYEEIVVWVWSSA